MNNYTHIHVKMQAGKIYCNEKNAHIPGPTDIEMWIPLSKAVHVKVLNAVLLTATSALKKLSTDQSSKCCVHSGTHV